MRNAARRPARCSARRRRRCASPPAKASGPSAPFADPYWVSRTFPEELAEKSLLAGMLGQVMLY